MSVLYCHRDNTWKVAGFGVAAEHPATLSNYYCPELLQNKTTFTNETDLWALGCLIYEIAALEPAFNSPSDICQYHSRKTPLRPSDPRVSEFLYCQFIESLLNESGSTRPTARDTSTLFSIYRQLLEQPLGRWLDSLSPKIPWAQWIELGSKKSPQEIALKIAEFYEEIHEAQVAGYLRRFAVLEDLSNICGENTPLYESNLLQGGATTSVATLETWNKGAPHDICVWHQLCHAYIRKHNYKTATAACESAKDRLPSNPSPFLTLSNLRAETGNFTQAIDAFLEIFDGDEQALPRYDIPIQPPSLVDEGKLKSLASKLITRGDNMSLHLAAWAGNIEAVEKWIAAGSPTDSFELHAFTPLHLAAWNMHTNVARKLVVAHRAWVNARGSGGWTALHFACANGDTLLINTLLQAGANCDSMDEYAQHPMHCAAEFGYSDAVKALFERGANVDSIDHAGGTPMHTAASRGYVQVVQTLSQLGVDVTKRNKKRETPILNAAENGHLQVVKTLLDLGADLSCTDNQGSTVMHFAARSGNPYLIRFLKSCGVNPSPRDHSSQTPIHQAASFGRPAAIKTLSELGAEISVVDERHWMPLHFAASSGHTSVIEALVDLHAELSPRDRTNSTPLHEATKAGHQDAADVLRKLGADIYAVDARGRRPCDYETKKYVTKKRKTDERAKTGGSNQRTKKQKVKLVK